MKIQTASKTKKILKSNFVTSLKEKNNCKPT